MKYVLLLLSLLLFVGGLMASERVRSVISFEPNSAQLTASAKAELDSIKAMGGRKVLEKIDIVALGNPGDRSFHSLKLSRDRTLEVYNYLTGSIPDEGDYELRYMEPLSPASAGVEAADAVLINAYFIRRDAPELDDPARELFPEEFGLEVPSSFASGRQVETRKPRKEKVEWSETKRTGQTFVLDNIFFLGNSARYTADSEETLQEVVDYLKANPHYDIKLIGHVNGRMGRGYLKKAARHNPERKAYKNGTHLSLARAESVRNFLVKQGVDRDRITCVGRGGKDRLYKKPQNDSENSANRRIEIVLID